MSKHGSVEKQSWIVCNIMYHVSGKEFGCFWTVVRVLTVSSVDTTAEKALTE
jgi:hypothetical protein